MKKVITMLLFLAIVSSSVYSCGETTVAPVGTDAETTAAVPTTVPDEITSFEDFDALPNDTYVAVTSYVQGKHAWEGNRCTLYLENDKGEAYLLYDAIVTKEQYDAIELGTQIKATGYKASGYQDIIEIVDAKVEVLDGSYVAEPVDLTHLIGDEEALSAYRNRIVAFKNVEVVKRKLNVDELELTIKTKRNVEVPVETEGEADPNAPVEYQTVEQEFETVLYIKASLTAIDSEIYRNAVGRDGDAKDAGERDKGKSSNLTGFDKGELVDIVCFLEWNDEALPTVATAYEHFENITFDKDGNVTKRDDVSLVVRHKSPYVDGKCNLYVMEGEMVYYIEALECTEEEYNAIKPGDKITITDGYKSDLGGLVKLFNVEHVHAGVADAKKEVKAPKDVGSVIGYNKLNNPEKFNQFSGSKLYVKFVDVKILDAQKIGDDYMFTVAAVTVDNATKELVCDPAMSHNVYIRADLVGMESDVYKRAGALEVGSVIDLSGFLVEEDCAAPSAVYFEEVTFVQDKIEYVDGKARIYARDKDGDAHFYTFACTEKEYKDLGSGKRIVVNGIEGESGYSNPLEITYAEGEYSVAKWTALVEDVTALVGTDSLKANVNKLVSIADLNVVSVTAEGEDYRLVLSNGSYEFEALLDTSFSGNKADVYLSITGDCIVVGDTVNITGYLDFDGDKPVVRLTEAVEHVEIGDAYVQGKASYNATKEVAAVYVQTADNEAYYIQDIPMTRDEYEALEIGVKVNIKGLKKMQDHKNDIFDINSAVMTVLYEYAEPVEAIDITNVNSKELGAYRSKKIEMKGMKVEKVVTQGNTGERTVTIDLVNGGSKISIQVKEADVGTKSDVFKTAHALRPGAVIDLQGFVNFVGTNAKPAVQYILPTYETYVQHKEAFLDEDGDGNGTAILYAQSENGDAYRINDLAMTKEEYDALVPGNKISVTSFLDASTGSTNAYNATFTKIDGEFFASPVSVNEVLSNEQKLREAGASRLVIADELVLGNVKIDDETKNITVNFGPYGKDTTLRFVVRPDLVGIDSEIYQKASNLKPGNIIQLTAYLTYDGNGVAATLVDFVLYEEVNLVVQAKMLWTGEEGAVGTCTLIAQPEDAEKEAYVVTSIEIAEKDYKKIKIGSRIRVTGIVDTTSGNKEFLVTKYQLTSGNATTYIAPVDITDKLDSAEELAAYENRNVTITGLTVSEVKLPEAGAADSSIVLALTNGTTTVNAKIDATLVEPTPNEIYALAKTLTAGSTVDVGGLLKLTRNGDAVEITPVLTTLTVSSAAAAPEAPAEEAPAEEAPEAPAEETAN